MSKTDKEGTIRVPGFIAAIIPDFNDPPADPAAWGWWTWSALAWNTSAPGRLTSETVELVRCDRSGVTRLA
jgi:hypothetical protein